MEDVQNTTTTNGNIVFRASQNVLPLEKSGPIQYPALHSVFTSTTQGIISKSSLVSEAQFNEDIGKSKAFNRNHDYRDLQRGSPYLVWFANGIRNAKTNTSIYDVLESVSKQTNILDSNPLYRIRKLTAKEKQKDFEVIIITGRGVSRVRENGSVMSEKDDERRFLYDEKILRHAFENSPHFKNKCKAIQLIQNPEVEELEKAVKERAASARKNGRNLVIFYSGHGQADLPQFGLGESKGREGDLRFEFEFGKDGKRGEYFSEDNYKSIMRRHAADIPTIHVFDSCYSGAAISANEHNLIELYQRA